MSRSLITFKQNREENPRHQLINKSQEFEKILQLALFVIDDEAETTSKRDIQLRVDQVAKVFKRLQDARVQAVEKFISQRRESLVYSGDRNNETGSGIQTANRRETRVSDHA